MELYKSPLVTGLSLVSCLGSSIEETWEFLCSGKDGLSPITSFDTEQLRSSIGGEIKSIYSLTGKDRMLQLSKEAITNTINDSGLTITDINQAKSALVLGTSLGHIFENENSPTNIDDYIPDVLNEIGLTIPFLAISSACSSGSDAISIGCDLIQFQEFDIVICGGVDILDIYKMTGHSSLHTLSPTKCRPFSIDSDGTSLGEGAAFIILEAPKNIKRKNANYYASIIGRSNTTDTSSVTAPDENGLGAIRVIEQAINQTPFKASDISYINAHGSGTPTNDKMEAKVYEILFSDSQTPVSSTKSAFGHTLGATGAIEAIIAILALNKKTAPPTAGLKKCSAEWENKNLIIGEPLRIDGKNLITASVTYGFGGANACLVFTNINKEI